MIVSHIRRTSGKRKLTYVKLVCPQCGKEFERELRNFNRGKLKDCCTVSHYETYHHHNNGFDFQQAYNAAYSNWKPSVEMPVLTRKQQQGVKEFFETGS